MLLITVPAVFTTDKVIAFAVVVEVMVSVVVLTLPLALPPPPPHPATNKPKALMAKNTHNFFIFCPL